jgi:hypothetical protein
MTDTLKDLWRTLGVSGRWGAILTLVVLVAAAVLKRTLDHAFDRQNKKVERRMIDLQLLQGLYGRVMDYSIAQSTALRLAYLDLFESDTPSSDGEAFARIVSQADERVMTILRSNLGLIDKETRNQVYKIHNELVQLMENPSLIEGFLKEPKEFFNEVEKVRDIIRTDRILHRLGLIEHTLPDERSSK